MPAQNVPTEPNAEVRQVASALWQMFVALTREGFTEAQALTIIGHSIAASMGGPAQ